MSAFGPSCRPSDILSVIDAVDGSSTRHVSAMDMGAVEALKGRVSATRLLQCVRQVLAHRVISRQRSKRSLLGV
jgi:DNA-binding NtrC family response regulator